MRKKRPVVRLTVQADREFYVEGCRRIAGSHVCNVGFLPKRCTLVLQPTTDRTTGVWYRSGFLRWNNKRFGKGAKFACLRGLTPGYYRVRVSRAARRAAR